MRTKMRFFEDVLYYQDKRFMSWEKCNRKQFAWILFKWAVFGLGCLLVTMFVLIAVWVFTIMLFSLTGGVA